MPNTYKILGQVNPSANTQANLEVVPAATEVVINSIQISNQNTSTNASYSLMVFPAAEFSSPASNGRHFIVRGATIPAGDAATLTLSLSLPAGAIVAANTNSANLSFSAFGVEIT
jgi:hypothetical protein